MKKKYHLMWLALLFTMQLSFAQRTIMGTVVESIKNEPLIGASVTVSGTTTGAVTDIDGKFSLNVPENATTLTVSFVGYITQDVALTKGQNELIIKLTEGGALQELVVVGYGTQKKKDLTV